MPTDEPEQLRRNIAAFAAQAAPTPPGLLAKAKVQQLLKRAKKAQTPAEMLGLMREALEQFRAGGCDDLAAELEETIAEVGRVVEARWPTFG